MPTIGAITEYIDVAQVTLYVFWFFFAGLVWYLHRENKREGYPLESDRSPYITVQGYPAAPGPKEYPTMDGGCFIVANGNPDTREIHAKPAWPFPGAPLDPTGDPMADGVGPCSWAERADEPDVTMTGENRIVPMRTTKHGFAVNQKDPDPRGLTVYTADDTAVGTVRDIWVDRSESMPRYLEVDVKGSSRRVLVPMFLAKVSRAKKADPSLPMQQRLKDGRPFEVRVESVMGHQFGNAPGTKNPEAITRLEEDRIMAYFGGGHFYATPERREAWL
ncbi:photosynthetic reaction center subunit H [Ectothiorhodospira mobilis]|uniref:Photosynthetic reaction center H subunit n=1 Tax=Ectothiorhodospira mobilis TaxID=195064 RepID=A0A1I4PM10_ECTMO|nr:photosynthetic reaction center subunit H [Ectothiorhodospira mobilis]MCG5535214.1 photosynthetic reaction center subunit H [Ectothiorhodospira mobilis]SFM28862.1 photosynthetic reaction center H subunit [Ectothiorhodospira mobilis]